MDFTDKEKDRFGDLFYFQEDGALRLPPTTASLSLSSSKDGRASGKRIEAKRQPLPT